MAKYRVTAHVTVSAMIEVTADSVEEAIAVAFDQGSSRVVLTPYGADRAGVDPTETWCIEDADGEPQRETAEADRLSATEVTRG